jgi:hypothetical protein
MLQVDARGSTPPQLMLLVLSATMGCSAACIR